MLYLANEDYKLKCYDSAKQEVDLSGLSPLCFIVQDTTKMKINHKKVITGLVITVTAATGIIKTTAIDGSAVTFVSAAGNLVGNTKKNTIAHTPLCLADKNATILNIATSECTKGKLTVIGTNAQSGATVTDVCDIWFSDAGQNKIRGN